MKNVRNQGRNFTPPLPVEIKSNKKVSTAINSVEFQQKNQFPKRLGFPLSALTLLVWYPYVSLVPDLLCNIGLSVSGLRKIRFNAYTPRRISTKRSVPEETRIPVVHVNNLRLVFLRFSVPWFFVQYRFECQQFTQNTFLRLYSVEFPQKRSVPKETRIPIVRVDNFNLLCLRFSVPWFIV